MNPQGKYHIGALIWTVSALPALVAALPLVILALGLAELIDILKRDRNGEPGLEGPGGTGRWPASEPRDTATRATPLVS